MSTTILTHRAPGLVPETGRIAHAVAMFGVSRSGLYRLAPQHPGLLVKLGNTTLVNYTVLRQILAAAPTAQVRPSRKAA